MVVRIALVFVGFILFGVFLNLYFMVYAFLGIFVLGIDNQSIHDFAYWVSFALGGATTIKLIRKVWPEDKSLDAKPTALQPAVEPARSTPIAPAPAPDLSPPPPPPVQSSGPSNIETCPNCGMRVFRKPDGSCPSCRKALPASQTG